MKYVDLRFVVYSLGVIFFTLNQLEVSAIIEEQLQCKAQPLRLESPMLALVDGNVMNADAIERVYSFKREVLGIMWGDKSNGARLGRYTINNKRVSAQDISQLERDEIQMGKDISYASNAKFYIEMSKALLTMKSEFLKASDRLNSIARGAKPIFGAIIEESCHKRNRSDSIVLLWAHTPEELEERIFYDKVNTVSEFTVFCIDLLNCLSDILNSCPKARRQFEERSEKWRLFEKVLHSVFKDGRLRLEFLKYVKINHLDCLSITDITPLTIKQLWESFEKKRFAV